MTPEQIIDLAKQANVSIRGHYDETGSTPAELQRFAELVRNEVLEEAALCADEHKHSCYEGYIDWHEASRIAAALRDLKS